MKTLTGQIIPIDWNENNEPIKYCLSTVDDIDYVIQEKSKRYNLRKYLNQFVEIYGFVGNDIWGDPSITPIKIKKIQPIEFKFKTSFDEYFSSEWPLHLPQAV